MARASRAKRLRLRGELEMWGWRILIATSRSNVVCRPRQTVAIPPSPIF